MNGFGHLCKAMTWFVPIALAALVAGCGGGDGELGSPTAPGAGTGVGGDGRGPSPVSLGTAGSFVILAQTAITNIPTSTVTGNVGLSPATGADIGLTCAEVTGVIYSVDAAGPLPCGVTNVSRLTAATGARGTAYADATGRAPDYTELGAGDIGGLNLGPATYKWNTAVVIPKNVTLTGGPNDVWIFQIAQGLSVSPGVRIVLAGGALPQNVYWATFAAADLGAASKFKGVILSQTSIEMRTGATIIGRLLAGTDVTLDQNSVAQ